MSGGCDLAREALVRIQSHEKLCEERMSGIADSFERIERANNEAHATVLEKLKELGDERTAMLKWLVIWLLGIVGALVGLLWNGTH